MKNSLVPIEALNELVQFCELNNFGMLSIGGEEFCVLVISIKELSPQQASLLSAHSLLNIAIGSAKAIDETEVKQDKPF
jgi:hypothetical protein